MNMPQSDTITEEKQIILKNEFGWFLNEEFSKLREGFIPTDTTDEMKEEGQQQEPNLKEKIPLTATNKNETNDDDVPKKVGGQFSFKQITVNKIEKVNCPIPGCDHKAEPRYMKVHLENEHSIVRQPPQIREAVLNRELD